MEKYIFRNIILLLVICSSTAAFALDTTEPYKIGLSDYEMYANSSGLGLQDKDRAYGFQNLMVVGLTDKFSASFSYTLEADQYLNSSGDGFGIGMFYNIIDSDSFDFDVYSGIGTGGGITVGTELNYDMSDFGVQLRLDECFNYNSAADDGSDEMLVNTAFTPLVYYSLNDKTQLLAAVDFSLPNNAPPGARSYDIGAFAAGLNIMVTSSIELITEVNVDIPQNDEEVSYGLMIGFLAALPVAGS